MAEPEASYQSNTSNGIRPSDWSALLLNINISGVVQKNSSHMHLLRMSNPSIETKTAFCCAAKLLHFNVVVNWDCFGASA